MNLNEIISILKPGFSIRRPVLKTKLKQSGLKNQDFSNRDLRGIDLENIDCSGSNFSRCNLQGANLSYGTFNNCNFSNTIMDGIKINKDGKYGDNNTTQFNNAIFNTVIMTNMYINNVSFRSVDFNKCDMRKTRIDDSVIYGSKFVNTILDTSNWIGVDFTECDLSNQIIKHCSFESCNFQKCKLIGTSFSPNVFFYQIGIYDTNASKSNFSGMSSENWEIKNSKFDDCDMTNIEIHSGNPSSFDSTSLRNVDFSGSRINDCDFFRCDMTNTKFVNADVTESGFGFKSKTLGMKVKNIYVSDDDESEKPSYDFKYFKHYVKPSGVYDSEYRFEPWKDVKHLIIKK